MDTKLPEDIKTSKSSPQRSGFLQQLSEHSYTPIILTAVMLILLFLTTAFIAYKTTPQDEAAKIEVTDDSPIPTSYLLKEDEQNIEQERSPIIKIEYSGGLCPEGVCYTSYQLLRDGEFYKDDELQKTLDQTQIDKLEELIQETDFEKIKATPFEGTCPVAYDGQEITYTFYTSQGEEVLPSCTYQIDDTLPLFTKISEIIGSLN